MNFAKDYTMFSCSSIAIVKLCKVWEYFGLQWLIDVHSLPRALISMLRSFTCFLSKILVDYLNFFVRCSYFSLKFCLV